MKELEEKLRTLKMQTMDLILEKAQAYRRYKDAKDKIEVNMLEIEKLEEEFYAKAMMGPTPRGEK